MKELISVAVLIASLFGGMKITTVVHDFVRRAALEKASHGLPSLPYINTKLR